jgi:hypothetical protein
MQPSATYLTKTKVSFHVVRTVACDGNNFLIISNAFPPAVTSAADRTKRRTVTLAMLKGTLSDSDVKFDLYDDGRLKNFNATSTGEGEAALKTVISIVPLIVGFEGGTKTYPAECAQIRTAGGEKPPASCAVPCGSQELQVELWGRDSGAGRALKEGRPSRSGCPRIGSELDQLLHLRVGSRLPHFSANTCVSHCA